MTTTKKNIQYTPVINHLRAYAAILVLFYHSVARIRGKLLPPNDQNWPVAHDPFMALIYEGHTGAAMHIVLIGFTLTYGSIGKNINYLLFIRDRISHIYPLMMTITFVGISMFPEKFTITGFICTVLPFQNTSLALQLGSFTFIFWTIAVEFQFYLIFPLLHKLLVDKGLFTVLPMLFLTMIIRVGGVLHGANPRDFSYWTIIGRLDQFIIGMMFAIVVKKCSIENHGLRWGGLIGGLALLLALFTFNRLGGWPVVSPWKIIWPPIEGLLWGATIVGYISFMHEKDNFVLRLIGNLGTISYSIYLLHQVISTLLIDKSIFFASLNNLYLNCFLSTIFIMLPATVIISSLTYHIIEKPFLELRQSYLQPVHIQSMEFNEVRNGS